MIVAPLLCYVNSAAASLSANLPLPLSGMPVQPRKAKVTDEHLQEAARLRSLWDAREVKLSQAEFGDKHKIGNQSAVGQFLRGGVPLSLNAAKGFAEGLKCQIDDFSPRLAKIAIEAGMLASAPEAPATPPDLTALNKMELQLVMLFRSLSHGDQEDLLQHVNHLYVRRNPTRSPANPYPHAPTPPKVQAKHPA